ncbi:hypothetical protein D3C77_804320 [compost metagenome]
MDAATSRTEVSDFSFEYQGVVGWGVYVLWCYFVVEADSALLGDTDVSVSVYGG